MDYFFFSTFFYFFLLFSTFFYFFLLFSTIFFGKYTAEKRDNGATENEQEGKKETTPQQQHEPGKYSTYGHHQAIASSIGLLFLGEV